MKNILLFVVLILVSGVVFSGTTTISNSGTTFSPSAATINLGDNIVFDLGASHNVVEVSLSTYNANGNTALAGGFSLPFGGGTVSAAFLTAGIHYYVCSPHATFGMKGTITVLNTTGLSLNPSGEGVFVYPNPSDGNFQIKVSNSNFAPQFNVEIYNLLGSKVYNKSDLKKDDISNIDAASLPKGTYVVKLFDGKAILYRKIVVRNAN